MNPELRRRRPDEIALQMRRLGKSHQAISYLEGRLSRHPRDVKSRFVLAMIIDESPRYPSTAALPLYEQVVKERRDWADAQHSLGWVYGMKLGRHEEAIEHMRLAVQLEPDDYSHWYGLGTVYQTADQLLDAKDAFQQCLARIKPIPEEEYMRRNVRGNIRLLDRRLRGDFRPVYPRPRYR